jgi:hypothetical protein
MIESKKSMPLKEILPLWVNLYGSYGKQDYSYTPLSSEQLNWVSNIIQKEQPLETFGLGFNVNKMFSHNFSMGIGLDQTTYNEKFTEGYIDTLVEILNNQEIENYQNAQGQITTIQGSLAKISLLEKNILRYNSWVNTSLALNANVHFNISKSRLYIGTAIYLPIHQTLRGEVLNEEKLTQKLTVFYKPIVSPHYSLSFGYMLPLSKQISIQASYEYRFGNNLEQKYFKRNFQMHQLRIGANYIIQ